MPTAQPDLPIYSNDYLLFVRLLLPKLCMYNDDLRVEAPTHPPRSLPTSPTAYAVPLLLVSPAANKKFWQIWLS